MDVRGIFLICSTALLLRSCSAQYNKKIKYLKPGYGSKYDALVADAARLRQVIFNHLIQDDHTTRELRSTILRHGFHDCNGGCDGCVDLGNPDNNRLDDALEITKQWHESADAGSLSRADVNALAAAVAAEIAINHSSKKNGVKIEFFPGREDCPDPNNKPERVFPIPFSPTAFEDLIRMFGLTIKQAVALLGAHSIGELELQSSGYGHFPWDEDEFSLDNEYYKELLEVEDWNLETVSNSIRDSSQWEDLSCSSCSHKGIMMLHADMGILKDYTVSGRFHIPDQCVLIKDCADRPSTAKFVKQFAQNNDAFIYHFIIAFKKMITTLPHGATQLYPPQGYPPKGSPHPSHSSRPKPPSGSRKRDRTRPVNRLPPSFRRNRKPTKKSRRPTRPRQNPRRKSRTPARPRQNRRRIPRTRNNRRTSITPRRFVPRRQSTSSHLRSIFGK